MSPGSPEGVWPRWLDNFGRRHPRTMLVILMALACVVTVLLLAKSGGPVVLYQRF